MPRLSIIYRKYQVQEKKSIVQSLSSSSFISGKKVKRSIAFISKRLHILRKINPSGYMTRNDVVLTLIKRHHVVSMSVRHLYEVMYLLGWHLNRSQWYNNPTGTCRCTDVDVTSFRRIDVSTTTLRHVPAWKPLHTYSSSGHN